MKILLFTGNLCTPSDSSRGCAKLSLSLVPQVPDSRALINCVANETKKERTAREKT